MLEDVRESVGDMAEILQCYESKNAMFKVMASSMCRRRKGEAEAATNAAVQRLEVKTCVCCFARIVLCCVVSRCY